MVDLDEAETLRKLAEDTLRQCVPMEYGGLRFVADVAPALAREIRRLRAALDRVLELHDEAHDTPDAEGAPTEPPDVVCRMRWVAVSELEGGPSPWWDMPYADESEAAVDRRRLA